MLLKCLILFLVICASNAAYYSRNSDLGRECPSPNVENGRVRVRPSRKFVKFTCNVGFSLVGDKYANCRSTGWDVPAPVCVKPAVDCVVPQPENTIVVASYNNAYLLFFCMPGYKNEGPAAIYCNGNKWNGTIPECKAEAVISEQSLRCDFEDPGICGWVQDERHDFNWERYNKKTPSSFLNTGPSYDHTFGKSMTGYYMYIESSSKNTNDTARLLSPIFNSSLASDGCFSFYYHMFGRTTGGLRIYQKPTDTHLRHVVEDDLRGAYLLFDLWGNQGDTWLGAVAPLVKDNNDFQIIIEGVRGTSFTSDIAVDDIAILQGANCSDAAAKMTTPTVQMVDSCSGRCDLSGTLAESGVACSCNAQQCIGLGTCCPDFVEICLFGDDAPSSNSLPTNTEKYISSHNYTDTTTTTTPKATTTSTTTSTTKVSTPSTSKATKPSTAQPPKTTTKRPTTAPTTSKTTAQSGRQSKTVLTSTKPPKVTTTDRNGIKIKDDGKDIIKTRHETIEVTQNKLIIEKTQEKSSGVKVTLLTIMGILMCAGLVWMVIMLRSARGRLLMNRFRGHTQNDTEVRFLSSDYNE